MDLLGLTTSEAIRAALGVSDQADELPDEVFTNHEMEDELDLLLSQWLLDAASTTILSVQSSGNQTASLALRQCAKYMGALLMVPSLATSTASKLSDGQDEFQREKRDLQQLTRDLEKLLGKYQAMVGDALGATAASFSIMGISSPPFDPVTGTTS